MTSDNPCESPPVVGPATDRILVRNFNHAGGPMAMALVIGPLLLGGMVWLVVTRGLRNTSTEGSVVILVVMSILQIAALVYVIRVPVLWIELGSTLRYGSLGATHEVQWGDVQRIWFDREDEYAGVGPVRINLSINHALVIQINDYKDLRVLVPGEKLDLLKQILSRHPRFKDSPFDDDAITLQIGSSDDETSE